MADFAERIAAAAGDATTLLRLALELMQANAKLEAEAAILAERRQRDAARKRRPRNSTDVRGMDGNSQDARGTDGNSSPPSPPSSFPTPHITPSSPPSPASASAAASGEGEPASGETADEARFYAEVASPAFAAIAMRFLTGKSATARIAWVGRFRGAMSRPPHPTIGELADALEDLMTRPPDDWTPTVFRTFVGRIRRDVAREAERNAAVGRGENAGRATPRVIGVDARGAKGVEAGNLVAAIRELIFEQNLPGQGSRKLLRNADVERMGDDVSRAYRTVGGAARFIKLDTKPDDLPYLIRDFGDALQAARAELAHPEAQSA